MSPIYEKINDYLMQGWGVIYAAESDLNRAVKQMTKMGIEVEAYVEKGALLLVGTDSLYSLQKTKLDAGELLDSWQELVIKMKKKGFEKILAIGTAEPFFERGNYRDKLVEYELAIGKKFQTPLEAVCCYSEHTVGTTPKQIIQVLSSHECTLHDGGVYSQWNPDRIMEVISSGLDRSFGGSASKLIFKTMKLIYKLDEDAILAKPELLEDALRKLSRDSAGTILSTLSDEFKQEMAWRPKAVIKN